MNKVKVEGEGQDDAVTSGCPSLGLPRIPSGADGTERGEDVHRQPQPSTSTLSLTDYEQIVADFFHKCNEAFIHAPQQRDARPGYFKVVVGEIADALASVVPVEKVKVEGEGEQRKEVVYRTPQHIVDFIFQTCNVPFADQADPAFLKKIAEKFKLVPVEESKSKVEVEERKEKSFALHDVSACVAKTPATVVMNFTLPSGRLISAEIHYESTTSESEAALFDGNNIVCRMRFFNQYQGRNWMYPIVRHACNGVVSKAGKKCRNRNNRKSRDGILTPKHELAETVRRQKMEN